LIAERVEIKSGRRRIDLAALGPKGSAHPGMLASRDGRRPPTGLFLLAQGFTKVAFG
jgi:hypothetical protein